jgi:hypothetical protein
VWELANKQKNLLKFTIIGPSSPAINDKLRPGKKAQACLVVPVIVILIVVAETFTLVAPDTIADFFLFALALVMTDNALFPATFPFILALIGTTALLSAVLAVIRTRISRQLGEGKQDGGGYSCKDSHSFISFQK